MASQLQLDLLQRRTWGGRRPGAGRKPNRARPGVSHLARPDLDPRHPVHVTLRVRSDVANLRTPSLAIIVFNAIRESTHESFRVIHFSVQHDHLHLVVEAGDREALARGMHGLELRLARRLNARLGRRGALFADRYHARALRTPTEIRNAIRSVLLNWEHHEGAEGIDPYSSAHPRLRPGVAEAQTWLGAVGWRRG